MQTRRSKQGSIPEEGVEFSRFFLEEGQGLGIDNVQTGGGEDDASSSDGESLPSSQFHPDDDSVGYSMNSEEAKMQSKWKREGDDDVSSGSDSDSEMEIEEVHKEINIPVPHDVPKLVQFVGRRGRGRGGL